MADINDFLSGVPTFQQSINGDYAGPAPVAASATPQATGTGNFVGAGLGSGIYGFAGNVAQGVQAGARLLGATNVAQSAADFAARQRATAATYARPDLENAAWYNPEKIAYQTLQGLPTMAAVAGGAALGGLAAPALAGAAALSPEAGAALQVGRAVGGLAGAYPSSVGEALDRARTEGTDDGNDNRITAAKAALLGVPEAALQTLLPEAGAAKLAEGVAKSATTGLLGTAKNIARGAGEGALIQAPVAATGEALMQQMGDPDRSFAERSQDILNAALSGGAVGGVFGGAIHGIAKTPAPKLLDDPEALAAAVDSMTKATQTANTQLPPPGAPGAEPRLTNAGDLGGTPEPPGGSRPFSGETIPMGQTHQGEPIVPEEQKLLPSPALEPASRPFSGETILMGQIHRGAPIVPEEQKLLPSPALEPASRPFSGETIPLPAPPVDPEVLAASHRQQITDATGGSVPGYLKGTLGDDFALKSAIYAEASKRDATGKIGAALTKIAKNFGVLDEKGNLVQPVEPAAEAEAADSAKVEDQANTTTLPPDATADVTNDVPARVLRDAIPDVHQPKWDALEKLRQSLPDNMTDFSTQIDDLQSKLAAPKRGEAGSVVKQTAELRKAIDGQKAVDKARGIATTPAEAASPVEEMQGAGKFTAPERPNDAVQERSPAPVDAREPPGDGSPVGGGDAGQAPARALDTAGNGQGPSTPAQGTLEPAQARNITAAMKPLRDNIGALMNEKIPPQTAKETEAGNAKRNAGYLKTVNALGDRADVITKAVKAGDAGALAKIGDDHFGSKLTDDFYDQASPKTQGLMDEHIQAVDKVLDAVREATGKNHPLGSDVYASREPTQRDQQISDHLDQGKSARDILADTVRNSTSSVRRTMAAKLLRMSNADPTIRFGTQDEAARDHPTLRQVYGDYNDGTDSIRVFDKADSEHTVLHEFTHAATVKALDDPRLAAEATRLFETAKAQMTPDERAHPSMANEKEFVAEALSNPDFASLLDNMDGPRGSLWQSIKSMISKFFGFPKAAESLLDHVEHLAGEASAMQNDANTLPGINRATSLYARSMQERGEEIIRQIPSRSSLSANIFKRVLMWRTLPDIARSPLIRKYLPYLTEKVLNNQHLDTMRNAHITAATVANDARRALPKEGQDALFRMMALSPMDIDPRKPLTEHTWLSEGQRKALAPEIQRANQMWNEARRGDGKIAQAYELARNAGDAHAMSLYSASAQDLVRRSGAKLDVGDVAERFQNETSGIKSDPVKSRQFWADDLSGKMDTFSRYVGFAQAKADKLLDPEQKAAAQAHIDQFKNFLTDASRMLDSLQRGPNFSMRRQGDHFVNGKILDRTEAGFAKLQGMFQKAGFNDIVLNHNVDNDQIYMRTQGIDSAEKLRQVMLDAAKKGLVDKEMSAGPVENMYQHPGVLPEHIRAQLEAIRETMPDLPVGTDPNVMSDYNQMRERAYSEMSQNILNALPDTSASKIFAQREGVQGANADMGKAFLQRSTDTASAISSLFMRERLALNAKDARAQLDSVLHGDQPINERDKISAAASEAFMRDAQKQWKTPPSIFDGIRHMTHFFELGLSVPYGLTLWSQTATLGLPELAKHFGFARSAQSLANQHAQAFQIMKAAFQGGDKYAFTLTPDKLRAAGVPEPIAQFMLRMDNRGVFNNSRTQWTYDDLKHHDGAYRKLHDVSGAWTLYSEMLPRIVQALSARELYMEREGQGKQPRGKDFTDMDSFAHHQVNESQFSWLQANNARAFGKQGVAGTASPLVGQFQGFRGKMLEKQIREFTDAVTHKDPEVKKQAQRYVIAHLAATTVLAGSMGLPGVSALAGAYDRLADLATGDDTHDLRASYREMLGNVFGPGLGEVLAHGAPRLGGLDLSEHLGEDRLVPFTDLLTDKRKLEDTAKDQALRGTGSAARLGLNMFEGARSILDGDYIEGATKLMPETLKNAAEGYMTAQYGYTDKSGFHYPGGPPSTQDIAEKTLGFTPADEANYKEKEKISSGLEERNTYDTQNIMSHLAKAFNRHDPQAYAYWAGQSQQFMVNHPGMMPPMAEFEQYLQQHMRSAALAGATGTPLGVNARDLRTRGMVSFGGLNQ